MNLDELFASAKAAFERHFGAELKDDWLRNSNYRYGVLKYMDFELRLYEAMNWAEKLRLDREKFEAERKR